MLTGFKKFILKGNVIDLAVAVVIGSAFSAVVDALVKSVLMPLISLLVGEPNFDDFLAFGDVRFGVLLTAVVNFLLVASALYFVIVAPMNRLIEHRNRKLGIGQDAKKEAAEDPQIALLKEIRDALQAQNQPAK
ncbi:large conductance mechanosensitive channel protein MscL [Arthrobacter sp. IA7]|uniref:large conductance mechanosensitive channel protein MscL n=1 Tax=Arthrobacter ipis TaxID=2716202 RepID=UPI001687D1AF|nr:large conductance mechanosensitive channel protein MscL [Arthrobacter ipis]MBD1544152.1 large conductance mechanosensitive channel protein MscL [Arthrobacter ipis]MDP9694087.1 large conductance mechanosensitive channel [Arthrobacter globiformis]